MKAKTKIHLKSSEEHLKAIYQALEPETREPMPRSSINLTLENGFLILDVKADDTVALRATLNTYLRWIDSMTTVLEALPTSCHAALSKIT